jgi:predicted alpha/beta hydrolase family esterase
MHAILVHGWRGWPENAWFPWLQRELESRGWTVDALKMPEPMTPQRDAWIATLEVAIERALKQKIPASKIVLVGHSLGCPTILFTLERHQGKPFGKAILVSGFGRDFGVPGFDDWVRHKVDFDAVRHKAKAWAVLHGAGDIFVPISEGRWLAERLDASFAETKWPGHFMHEEGVTELPEILDVIV